MEIEEEIKIKARQALYNTTEYTVESLVYGIKNKEITFYDSTKWRWDVLKQSQSIESMFLGVPIQAIFMLKEINTKKVLDLNSSIDFVTTLNNFVLGKLTLTKLSRINSLNGVKFNNLSIDRQRKFLKLCVKTIVLDRESSIKLFEEIY
jgi:hypothetical protein